MNVYRGFCSVFESWASCAVGEVCFEFRVFGWRRDVFVGQGSVS